jgi:UDP-3-O-[3-hydroxymyristoyl] glucosamine N-acyltransferase
MSISSHGRKDACDVSITIRQLADLVQGEVCGDGELVIQAARALTDAGPGDITFAENDRYVASLHSSRASAAVVRTGASTNGLTVIRVAEPLSAFITIAHHFRNAAEPPPRGIDPRASVDSTSVIGPDPSVYPFASIGAGTVIGARCRLHPGVSIGRNCRVGDDAVLHPNVVVYDDTILGDRVIIHGGAVIGADGFGYRFQNGRQAKVPQLGRVEIGDDVEIGAGTTIDRGTFGPTVIGSGTKIDNLVQIGHNCRIGRHNLLVAAVAMGGSCTTGDYVILAGQVGVADHLKIGDGTSVGAQSGVASDLGSGERVLGTPPIPEKLQKRVMVSLAHLPDIRRDMARVKKHLGMVE